MGQKVNPISLRLQQTNRHFDACWFNDYNYTNLLNRDIKIQSYINFVLKQLKYPSARFFIQNLPNKIKINVFFLNPKSFRKNASGGFQLKDFSKIKNLSTVTKKTKQIKETTPWFLDGTKARALTVSGRTTAKQFKKRNFFLKHYKSHKNSKIKALSYFLLNSGTSNKKSYNKNLTLPVVLPDTGRTQGNGQSNSEIQIFLRYLLLKNFCLSFKQELVRRQTQSFLLANLMNFTLLNNKNKRFLAINYLTTKINNYKQYLQQNAIKNKTKLSSLTTNKKIKTLKFGTAKCKQDFVPLLKNQSSSLSFNRASIGFNNNALNSPAFIPANGQEAGCFKHPNYYISMMQLNKLNFDSLPYQNLNTNYLFLSLMNKESLNKSHNRYSQVFNKFNHLCTPYPTEDGKDSNLTILQKNYKKNEKKVLLLRNSSYKKHLELQFSNVFSSDVVISFFRFFNEKQSALFLAEEIIYYLEKRVSFFKIKNQILREINKNLFLKGLRITCSGRVGGRSKKAQRAKTQIIKYGQTSLHVFSSKIDFASKHANTAFGLLGIKVWICYN